MSIVGAKPRQGDFERKNAVNGDALKPTIPASRASLTLQALLNEPVKMYEASPTSVSLASLTTSSSVSNLYSAATCAYPAR